MEKHNQTDDLELFDRYRQAIGFGNGQLWDDDATYFGLTEIPRTKGGKMPKRMRVKGCWCWDSWHSRLDASHQWTTDHLAAKHNVEVEVLKTIRILPYSLGGIRSWNRELTQEQWQRTIPGGKPTLIFLTNYALAVHFAIKLGVVLDDWQYEMRNKMYKDMVPDAKNYEEPEDTVRDYRRNIITYHGEKAPEVAGLEIAYSGGDPNA